jgi:hypothetical protein
LLLKKTPVNYDDYYIIPACVPTSGTPTYEGTKGRYMQNWKVKILPFLYI